MARQIRTVELLAGVEGLALLRGLHEDADGAAAERRLAELGTLLDDASLRAGEVTSELDPRRGYDAWAPGYDAHAADPSAPDDGTSRAEAGADGASGSRTSRDGTGDNPIVALEQAVVWPWLEASAPGSALDAACGTGRHARRLAELGHAVTAVDGSEGMLARAAEAVPSARCLDGDLRALPLDDAAFDLVVCALALSHLADLRPPTLELARVLAPGGRLVVSVLHPVLTHLGWHARFTDADGERHFVREHPHTHADYLRAFRDAGLEVVDCAEPVLRPSDVRAQRRAFRHVPEALESAYSGLPAVLVWDLRRAGTRQDGAP